jgi:hypothetical protein
VQHSGSAVTHWQPGWHSAPRRLRTSRRYSEPGHGQPGALALSESLAYHGRPGPGQARLSVTVTRTVTAAAVGRPRAGTPGRPRRRRPPGRDRRRAVSDHGESGTAAARRPGTGRAAAEAQTPGRPA